MYCFSTLSALVSIGTMALLVVLQRGAFGMIFSASDTAMMRTLPVAERSMGAGLHNMHRGIAMAFGVALCSVLLEKRLLVQQMTPDHRLAAYQDCFLVIGISFLLALLPAWLSRPRALRRLAPLPAPQAAPAPVRATRPDDDGGTGAAV
jgi:MFS family permease